MTGDGVSTTESMPIAAAPTALTTPRMDVEVGEVAGFARSRELKRLADQKEEEEKQRQAERLRRNTVEREEKTEKRAKRLKKKAAKANRSGT